MCAEVLLRGERQKRRDGAALLAGRAGRRPGTAARLELASAE
jgi:hypothetical protein